MSEKIYFLGKAAQFDICAPQTPVGGERNFYSFIYPARIGKNQVVPLFKVLLSNACLKNCLYCANRSSLSIPRFSLKPEELVFVFWALFRKGMVKGLFLSSAVSGNSILAMDRMIKAVEILRFKYGFQGYVHLKILPGAEFSQVERAVEIADRVSVNLEAPSSSYLQKIAPEKDYFKELLSKLYELKKLKERGKSPRSGVTTQFVVGAAGESDKEILTTLFSLYKKGMLKRGYFSAYRPVSETPLSSLPTPSWREKRLYQADYLLRFYGFTVKDLPFDAFGNLPLEREPKEAWAEKNRHLFPLNINRASYEELIKVPGIGPLTARRIIYFRREKKIRDQKELLKLGARINKAFKYITFS